MTRYVINIVASRDLMEISDYFYSRNVVGATYNLYLKIQKIIK